VFSFCSAQEGGMLALYRGFLPTVCGMFINGGIAFSCYETLKNLCIKHLPDIACQESSQNSGTVSFYQQQ
jgi:solute carrier family 25 protein 16